MAPEGRNELDPKEIARAAFPAAFRGYDQDSVRQYLTRLAQAVARAQQRGLFGVDHAAVEHADSRAREFEQQTEELRHRVLELEGLLAAEASRAADSPIALSAKDLNESDLIELLGQETARVLGTARVAAADTVNRANAEAAEIAERAHHDAEQTRKEADMVLTAARVEGRKIKESAAEDVRAGEVKLQAAIAEAERASRARTEQIVAEATRAAESELQKARQEASRIIGDAESLREEILTDLLRRRRANQEQLDRLVGAKTKLAHTLNSAKSHIDEVAAEIRSTQLDNVEIDLEEIELNPTDDELAEIRGQLTPGHSPSPSVPAVNPSAGEDDTHQLGARPKGRHMVDASASGDAGHDQASMAPNLGGQPDLGRGSHPESGDGHSQTAAIGSGQTDTVVASIGHQRERDGDSSVGEDPVTTGTVALLAGDSAVGAPAEGSVSGDALGFAELSGAFADIANDTIGSWGADEGEDDTVVVNLDEELQAFNLTSADEAAEPTGEVPAVGEAWINPTESGDGFQPSPESSVAHAGHGVGDELTAFESPRWTWDGAQAVAPGADDGGGHGAGDGGADDAGADDSVTGEPGDGNGSRLASPSGSGVNEQSGVMPAEAYVDVFERDIELETTPLLGKDPASLRSTREGRNQRGDLHRGEAFDGHLPYGFESRDIALSRSTPGFKRRLKRAVNDDQSHVLDRIRSGKDVVTASELPKFAEQLERYLSALRPALLDVVRLGGELQGSVDVPYQAVENLSLQLAKHLVDCVRQPTVKAIDDAATSDREAIMDPIRTTYRDFRNSVLPDLVDDALHEAFSLGLYHGIDDADQVVWVTDPRLDPDPICEDNAASPALAKGSVFPSGHMRPLSMPGCRCLVLPAG